jgi:hypothetical protein
MLFGCGGDSGVSISACDKVAELACHNGHQCRAEEEIERFVGVGNPRSEGECRTDVSRRCGCSIASSYTKSASSQNQIMQRSTRRSRIVR